MKTPTWFASCVLAGCVVHGTALAQGSPLAAALEAAWNRSVQARAAEGERGLAAAQSEVAGTAWAAPPSMELSHRSDRLTDNAGRNESEAGLVWPLLLPGQRAARQSAAKSGLEAAEAAVAAAKLRLAGEVREAAWAVVAREGEAAISTQQAQGLEALARDVDRRVQAGELARADALAARAEFLEASAAAALARRQADLARSQWKVLTGLAQVPDPAEAPAAAPGQVHPELALATLAAANARGKYELERSARRDPPELALRYRREVSGTGLPADRSIGVGLRIPFGTDDRNLPRERAALAAVETARAQEEHERLRLEAELANARSALQLAEAQAEAQATRATLLRERATLIDRSFRAGETALPELLRAAATATQAEAALAAQRAALGLARARLNQAYGLLP